MEQVCVWQLKIIIEFEKGIVNKSAREIEIEQYKNCLIFKQEKKSQTKNNQGDPRKEERIVQTKKHTIKGAREFLPTVAKIT